MKNMRISHLFLVALINLTLAQQVIAYENNINNSVANELFHTLLESGILDQELVASDKLFKAVSYDDSIFYSYKDTESVYLDSPIYCEISTIDSALDSCETMTNTITGEQATRVISALKNNGVKEVAVSNNQNNYLHAQSIRCDKFNNEENENYNCIIEFVLNKLTKSDKNNLINALRKSGQAQYSINGEISTLSLNSKTDCYINYSSPQTVVKTNCIVNSNLTTVKLSDKRSHSLIKILFAIGLNPVKITSNDEYKITFQSLKCRQMIRGADNIDCTISLDNNYLPLRNN